MINDIINQIKENLIEIIPELAEQDIPNDSSLRDLGANSIDRGELITITLEQLDSDISRIEFVGAQTIQELADLITEKTN